MRDNGLDVNFLQESTPGIYDGILGAMDDFADQYAAWKLKKRKKNCEKCKVLLSELRKHYLVEIDSENSQPKADIDTILNLWNEVNKILKP